MIGGVGAQVARDVGAADRIRLADEVVGEADVAIRIGAAELGQRGSGASADLGLVDTEEGREVAVALPTLEQERERGALVGRDRHRTRKPTGWPKDGV